MRPLGLSIFVFILAGLTHPLPNLLQFGQPLAKLLRLVFQLVVQFSHLLVHKTTPLAVQICFGQTQIGLGFTAIALHARTCLSGNFEHGHVFTQGMDEKHTHALVACVHHGMREKPPTQALATLVC